MVESIFDFFNAPVSAHQGEDDLRGGLVGGHGGQAMHGLVLDLADLDDAPLALDAKGDLTMRQAGALAVLGEVEHPAASLLDSSVCLVRGPASGCSVARTSGRSQSSPAKSASSLRQLSLTAVIT